MKRLRTAKAMAIGVLATGLLAEITYAQNFKCGSDLLTYEVVSSDHQGIRCVRYDPQDAELFVWYGEGRRGQRTYRHVGIAFRGGADIGTTGRAADMTTGNGEDFNNNVTGLVFVADGSWPRPSMITVTGSWNEQWNLRTDGVNYYPLPMPTSCGQNFAQYDVGSLGGVEGSGLRCVLRTPGTQPTQLEEGSAPYQTAWFGNGNWQGRTYAHIGRLSIDRGDLGTGSPAGTGRASDICDPHFGQICNSSPPDPLKFSYRDCRVGALPTEFTGYSVGGPWKERWTLPDNLTDCNR
jgi:hypothetical protein